MLAGTFAWDQWAGYERALASARRETSNVTVLLAEHTARVFHAAEETLRAVAQVRLDAIADPARWPAVAIHERLKTLQQASPLYRAIGWFDADGNRIATSQSSTPPPLNIARQENFLTQQESAVGFHIAATARSAQDGRPLINTSIPLHDSQGRFAGLAGVALDPIQLADIYRKVDLGPSRALLLARADGAYLARSPHIDSSIGSSLAASALFREHLPKADSGHYRTVSLIDGVERLVSYERVPRLPLVAVVSVSLDDALAEFRRRLITGGAWLAAMIAALAAAAWLLIVQTRRQERSEARLQAGEVRFQDFAAASADWFWETDEDGRFVWITDVIEKATGRQPAWFYGKTREEIGYDGVSAEQINEHLQLRREHRPFRDFEFRHQGLNGQRWIRISGAPVFDADGRFRGYRGTARDVTELRRAEQRLRDAVEAIPGRFMLFDADDRLSYANHADDNVAGSEFARIGETFENMLRATVAAGSITEATDDPEGWIAERLRRHRAANGTTVLHRGGRIYEVIERPTHEGGVVTLRFDVTERERTAEAERKARADADAASNAKSDFLSRMSHELRTPLNAIIGFAQMLQIDRERSLTANQKEYSDYILAGGRHLLNLVNEVLDLASVEAGRVKLSLEPVAVADVVAQAVQTMRPVAAKAGVTFRGTEDIAEATVRADTQRLLQVLLNLLSNAIKYNRPDGTVTVSATRQDGRRIRIGVSDTGVGIEPEYESRLFEPFQRLGAESTAVEGTGIGLALSKRLVEIMGGRIGYTTEVGRGSTFWVEFPAETHVGTASPAAVAASVGAPNAVRGYSLLYVEDNPANLRLMEHVVATRPDVSLFSAPSGPLGIELAVAHRPDVIVLDLNLPGMSGYDVLKRLKALPETRETPVIALTAAAMPADVARGIAAGFFRYVTKPLDVTSFLGTIDAALAETQEQRTSGTARPIRL
jgi:PAS domain S-box-containing protein